MQSQFTHCCMQDYSNYISIDPKIALGKPTIKGTRISVDVILDQFAGGKTVKEVLKGYPHLTKKQIEAAISYAATRLRGERIYRLDDILSDPPLPQHEVAH